MRAVSAALIVLLAPFSLGAQGTASYSIDSQQSFLYKVLHSLGSEIRWVKLVECWV